MYFACLYAYFAQVGSFLVFIPQANPKMNYSPVNEFLSKKPIYSNNFTLKGPKHEIFESRFLHKSYLYG
jgi:hypothetical protein